MYSDESQHLNNAEIAKQLILQGTVGSKNAEIRTLLDNGGLCLECILRYKCCLSGGESEDVDQAVKGTNVECDNCSGLVNHTRQTSGSSSTATGDDWPGMLPPPPPHMHALAVIDNMHQKHRRLHETRNLPHIITTECDSINELDNYDGRVFEIQEAEGGENRARAESTNVDEKRAMDLGDREEPDFQFNGATTNQTSEVHSTRSITGVDFSDDNQSGSIISQVSRTRKLPPSWLLLGRAIGSNNGTSNRSSSDPSVRRGRGTDSKLADMGLDMATAAELIMSASKAPNASLKPNYVRDKQTARKTSGYGELAYASNPSGSFKLNQIANKQRSLSLSNSNLSTLPNATGLLADVFVCTLFNVTGSGHNHRQRDQGATTGRDERKDCNRHEDSYQSWSSTKSGMNLLGNSEYERP